DVSERLDRLCFDVEHSMPHLLALRFPRRLRIASVLESLVVTPSPGGGAAGAAGIAGAARRFRLMMTGPPCGAAPTTVGDGAADICAPRYLTSMARLASERSRVTGIEFGSVIGNPNTSASNAAC